MNPPLPRVLSDDELEGWHRVARALGETGVRILKEMENYTNYTQYDHHGNRVWVRADLRGRHRNHCLCQVCTYFQPGTLLNCEIAQATYENCVKYGTVTPIWECPKFAKKVGGD